MKTQGKSSALLHHHPSGDQGVHLLLTGHDINLTSLVLTVKIAQAAAIMKKRQKPIIALQDTAKPVSADSVIMAQLPL